MFLFGSRLRNRHEATRRSAAVSDSQRQNDHFNAPLFDLITIHQTLAAADGTLD
jgi:hypothetical protein